MVVAPTTTSYGGTLPMDQPPGILNPASNPLLAHRGGPQRPPPLVALTGRSPRAGGPMLSPSSFLKTPSPPNGDHSPRANNDSPLLGSTGSGGSVLVGIKPSSPLAGVAESRLASLLTALSNVPVSSNPSSHSSTTLPPAASITVKLEPSNSSSATHFTLTPIMVPPNGSSLSSSLFSVPTSPLVKEEPGVSSSNGPARPVPIKLPTPRAPMEAVQLRKLPSVPEWADGMTTSSGSGGNTPLGMAGIPSFRRIESFVGKDEGFSLFSGNTLGVPEVASPRSPLSLSYDHAHHDLPINPKPNASPTGRSTSLAHITELGSSLLAPLPEPAVKIPVPVRRTAAASGTLAAVVSGTAGAAIPSGATAAVTPVAPPVLPSVSIATSRSSNAELLLNIARSPGGTIISTAGSTMPILAPRIPTGAGKERAFASGGKIRPSLSSSLMGDATIAATSSIPKRKAAEAAAAIAPPKRVKREKVVVKKEEEIEEEDAAVDDDDLEGGDGDAPYKPPASVASSSSRPRREAAAAAHGKTTRVTSSVCVRFD